MSAGSSSLKEHSRAISPSDDRFIAKELSRAELETMATFGPAYFDYMSSAIAADVRPQFAPERVIFLIIICSAQPCSQKSSDVISLFSGRQKRLNQVG